MLPSPILLIATVLWGGSPDQSAEPWREDLSHLVKIVREQHPSPYTYGVDEEEFLEAVRELDQRIPALSDGRIVLEIFRVFALLDDSHSEPFWNTIPQDVIDFRSLPIQFTYFEDGLYVTRSLADHADLLGAKLIAVEGGDATEALNRSMIYMSGDNAIRRRTVAVEVVLSRPGVMQVLELCRRSDAVQFTFRLDGKEMTKTLDVVEGPSFPPRLQNEATVMETEKTVWSNREWIPLNDPSSLPLWLQDRGRRYWFEYLPESRLLYMRFKRVIDDPQETFDDFTDRMFTFIENNRVDKLVVDMRKNRGGYGRFGLKFVERLSACELASKGRLFVITGRGTKSAAPYFARRLELAAEPIFVGEISGGRPAPFGNCFTVTLPNSGVSVRCAKRAFLVAPPADLRKTIAPDLRAPMTVDAFRANRDPSLEAILAYPSPESSD